MEKIASDLFCIASFKTGQGLLLIVAGFVAFHYAWSIFAYHRGRRRCQDASNNSKLLPPTEPNLMPVVGNLGPLAFNTERFVRVATSYRGSLTSTRIPVLDSAFYMFTDRDAVSELMRAEPASFHQHPKPLAGSNVAAEDRIDFNHHWAFHRVFLGPGLTPIRNRFRAALRLRVDAVGNSSEWFEVNDPFSLIGPIVSAAMVEAIFRPSLLELNSDLNQNLWAYDDTLPWLARGIPRCIYPAPHRTREEIPGQIKRWHAYARQNFKDSAIGPVGDGDPYWGSEMVWINCGPIKRTISGSHKEEMIFVGTENRNLYRSISTQLLPLPYPDQDFTGKVVLITGSNSGLGLEAARHFVRLGASRVILGCRNLEKGDAAKRSIEASGEAQVEVWQVDLESFDSVKAFCRRAAALDRLDIVIENAALLRHEFAMSEGYERLTTVNVISTWLMGLLLLPVLRHTGRKFYNKPGSEVGGDVPHLVLVGSNSHFYTSFKPGKGPVIFDELKGDVDMFNRYADTKMMAFLMAREIAKRMVKDTKEPDVVLNIVEPGYCQTELFRDTSWGSFFKNFMNFMLRWIGRTPEMGSRTYLHAAAAGRESHGIYLEDCKLSTPHKFVDSEKGEVLQQRVFRELIQILESIEPGISSNI
ncbi:Short chain dehydrogenase atnD [Paramyrothecium foliicola]|nr:Short chain dehydrogenase atnD [Paramyrothecium foliicola]